MLTTKAQKVKKASVALEQGKQYLEAHKWGKHSNYNPKTGAVCAFGALNAVGAGNPESSLRNPKDPYLLPNPFIRASRFLDRTVQNSRRNPASCITFYNDRPTTTKAKVLAKYDEAIALAKFEGD